MLCRSVLQVSPSRSRQMRLIFAAKSEGVPSGDVIISLSHYPVILLPYNCCPLPTRKRCQVPLRRQQAGATRACGHCAHCRTCGSCHFEFWSRQAGARAACVPGCAVAQRARVTAGAECVLRARARSRTSQRVRAVTRDGRSASELAAHAGLQPRLRTPARFPGLHIVVDDARLTRFWSPRRQARAARGGLGDGGAAGRRRRLHQPRGTAKAAPLRQRAVHTTVRA
jgi:hypothetical protein